LLSPQQDAWPVALNAQAWEKNALTDWKAPLACTA